MLPGTLIKTGLEFMGIDPAVCNCEEHAAQMDAWGVVGCRDNLEKIVGWFVLEGRRWNVPGAQQPIFKHQVRAVIKAVIDRSEQLLPPVEPVTTETATVTPTNEPPTTTETTTVEPVNEAPTDEPGGTDGMDDQGQGGETTDLGDIGDSLDA